MLNLRVAALFSLLAIALCLDQYNVDPNSITVSGISSGAAFATQFHVIYSQDIKGVATFAGVVYYCAYGSVATSLTCMSSPGLTNVNLLITDANVYANDLSIDATSGMSGDNVFVFAGSEDTVVDPGNGPNIVEFYNAFSANIHTSYGVAAQHCQPTNFYGAACDYKGGEYINNCNYDGAYNALNFLYDNSLTQPSSHGNYAGQLNTFDQEEFFNNNAKSFSMASTGYIYIPSVCVDKTTQCKLHVAFHGCQQGSEYLGDTFVTETGYIEVGELNNIIVIFPQIEGTLSNPQGCWDWWGYTGILNYATNSGAQPMGIKAIIDRVVYGT